MNLKACYKGWYATCHLADRKDWETVWCNSLPEAAQPLIPRLLSVTFWTRILPGSLHRHFLLLCVWWAVLPYHCTAVYILLMWKEKRKAQGSLQESISRGWPSPKNVISFDFSPGVFSSSSTPHCHILRLLLNPVLLLKSLEAFPIYTCKPKTLTYNVLHMKMPVSVLNCPVRLQHIITTSSCSSTVLGTWKGCSWLEADKCCSNFQELLERRPL